MSLRLAPSCYVQLQQLPWEYHTLQQRKEQQEQDSINQLKLANRKQQINKLNKQNSYWEEEEETYTTWQPGGWARPGIRGRRKVVGVRLAGYFKHAQSHLAIKMYYRPP